MPIVIEEMTGEIVPPRSDSEEGPSDRGAPRLTEGEMRRRIRQVMARETRYSDRLSDR